MSGDRTVMVKSELLRSLLTNGAAEIVTYRSSPRDVVGDRFYVRSITDGSATLVRVAQTIRELSGRTTLRVCPCPKEETK